MRRRLVRAFISWASSWNKDIHEAIEAKVFEEFNATFPNEITDTASTIEGMRAAYYTRMTNTTNVLVAGASLLVSLVALLVALLAMFH
ncbi:MAG: hypothetical protein WCL27_07615 [Betaproteobacteria bacterium]